MPTVRPGTPPPPARPSRAWAGTGSPGSPAAPSAGRRSRGCGSCGSLQGGDLLAGQAEAALAPGEVVERARQRGDVEFGPQGIGEPQFGVGEMPQQEVADPHVAAGADRSEEHTSGLQSLMSNTVSFF